MEVNERFLAVQKFEESWQKASRSHGMLTKVTEGLPNAQEVAVTRLHIRLEDPS